MRISIVTTIYKAEKDLPRLLDSMMSLKSPDLEFFLIDNGSPDRCGEICKEYARKDDRFFVRTLEDNIGYIRARMLGIRECHGDYVGFCDSDDYLEPDGYDHAFQVISQQKCDLYITSHKVQFGENVYTIQTPLQKGLYLNDEINQMILPQAFGFLKGRERLHGFMWKQIYRKSIILDAGINLIEELKPWEDQVFNIDVIKHCQRIFIDDCVIYHYFANTGSITASLINNFDATDFWKKTQLLRQEKSKRAETDLEHRATANSSLANLDSLAVSLSKNENLSNIEVAKSLRSLLKGNGDANQILSDSSFRDLSHRLRFVKICLRLNWYRLLVCIVRHKLNK